MDLEPPGSFELDPPSMPMCASSENKNNPRSYLSCLVSLQTSLIVTLIDHVHYNIE